MKRLVVSALGNRIYYANIKKDGTMGAKEDITDRAIESVFIHLMNKLKDDGKEVCIKYDGYTLKMVKE